MLQMLHNMPVANICFQVFQVFHTYVASVFIYRFCKDLGVAYVCNGFFKCFLGVSDVCFKCFNCFDCMLQLFYLNVVKVDLLLHMLQ
jgi:hypothetical protein